MKLFIDSSDVAEIREGLRQGIIDGVSTNPSLMAQTGRPGRELLAEICQLCQGPVSAEVMAQDRDGMMREGRELAKVAPNLVVTIPFTGPGLDAVRMCADEGITTSVTLCRSPVQALLAARAGARYVSPLMGRLDDGAGGGMDVVRKIVAIYRNFGFKTEVLVSSVRSPSQIVEAALCGAQAASGPHAVLQQLVNRPLPDGPAAFLTDRQAEPR